MLNKKKSVVFVIIPLLITFFSVSVIAHAMPTQSFVQVNQFSPAVTPVSEKCYDWTTNLRVGDQGVSVTKLQKVLANEGLLNSSNALQKSAVSSVFDEKTASAVVGFQQKYSSEILAPNGLSSGTGYVGPSTRKKLNQLSGCNDVVAYPVVSTLTVLAPNGGEVWPVNSYQTIKWYDTSSVNASCPDGINCMSPAPKYYDISLISNNGASYKIASSIVNTSYSWIVSSATVGSYKLQVCQSGTNQCDTSDSYINISNGGSQPEIPTPPQVSGIDSQNPGAGLSLATDAKLYVRYLSDLKEDRAGGWHQFSASGNNDYVNQATLTLSSSKTIKSVLFSTNVRGLAGFTSESIVDGMTLYPAVVVYSGQQLNTKYDQNLGTYGPGTYIFNVYDESTPNDMLYSTFGLTFYFTDGTYVTATTPGTGGGQNTSDALLYPKGGENYQIGGQIKVRWNTNSFTGSNVGLILRRANTGSNFPGDSGAQAQRVPNTGSYTITISNIGEGGQYYLRIICDPYSSCNYVDSKMFTINSSSHSPSIQVVSPNGGETLPLGSTQNISWLTNTPSISSLADTVKIYIEDYAQRQSCYGTSCQVGGALIADGIRNNGNYTWVVGNAAYGSKISTGAYVITICSKNYSDRGNCDSSDSYFKISNSSTDNNTVTEQVRCVFSNSGNQESCYTATNSDSSNWFKCSGVGSCSVDVKGVRGSQLTWKSSCGDSSNKLPISNVDGYSESVNFSCNSTTPYTFTVLTPTANENLIVGNKYIVNWKSSDRSGISYAVYLVGGKLGPTGNIYLGSTNSQMSTGSGISGSFVWQLPTYVEPGSGYQISLSGKGATGGSSASFNIIRSELVSTSTPYVPALYQQQLRY